MLDPFNRTVLSWLRFTRREQWRKIAYGNLYLTEKEGGEDFTDEDQELVELLASQAAVAIENARLYEAATGWSRQLESLNEVGNALATETDRTLFFDFLPLDLGTVRGFKTRFHLYTVPGQVFYEASRKLILKGADGVVFVADSQEELLDANFETQENLHEHLKEHNLKFDTIPYVLQLNKRDLPNALPVDVLTKHLQKKGEPVLEGVAVTGQGVFETLKEVAKLVLAELKKSG